MRWRHGHHGEDRPGRSFGPGFGGLLRSLFANLPWAESATREESLIVPAPAGRAISVHNANGKTRIVGEDRQDIEIRTHKRLIDIKQPTPKTVVSLQRLDSLPAGVDIEIRL